MSVKLSPLDRIVVTGIGLVSPLGCDPLSFHQNLSAGTACDHGGRAVFDGHIRDFGELPSDTKRVLRKSLKLMNRETQLGVAAAQHAINDSDLAQAGYAPERIGVCFGAGNVTIQPSDFTAGVDACRVSELQSALAEFDPGTWGAMGIAHMDPLWILRVLPNMPACHAAIANDLRGPNNTITHADVATNMAFAEAANAILDGDADAMIVGGTGTNLSGGNAAVEDAGAEQAAEAAAAFVIERVSAAVGRGATVFGEILGTASATMIAPDHRAMPQQAAAVAIKSALERSELSSDAINIANCSVIDFAGASRLNVAQRIGNAAAGTAALEIAASLIAFQNDGSDSAINISSMPNGLASCIVLGSSNRRAA